MRKVLMMFLWSLSILASATDYYVSSSGNDSADGRSSSTPWQTITKVNSVFSSLYPGDRILFNRGDVFYGTLQIARSGISGSPITIGAYGSGANPIITGFTTISGWNNYGNGIYSRSVSCESNPNMVTVNGTNTAMGRWPNTGFLYLDSHVSTQSITDSELPASPDWTGAEVVIRKVPFVYDRNTITDHTGNTITYKTGSDYTPRDGYGYFIQNNLQTLDKTGEWYYDGSTFYMYFGTADPNSSTVRVSTRQLLVNLLNNNYITIENITFEGANNYAIQISNSDYVTVQNCTISFTGNIAIYGPWNGTSPYCKILNNSISNSNNIAIKLDGDHTNATVINNLVVNTGITIGMGGNSDGGYMGLDINGDNSLIQYNVVENTGYVGIKFAGDNTMVSNNLVNKFNLVKNDGGGIYTYVGTDSPDSGQKVIGNVVLSGTGLGEGLPDRALHGIGIYMDDQTQGVTVNNNTVAHCNLAGIYLHNAHEIELNNNTLYNNGSGDDNIGSQILFVHDTYSPDDPIRNVTMNNNIFFARTKNQFVLAFSTVDNDISSFGTSDYNYFARPIDNNSYVARTWAGGWNSPVTNRSLSSWQSYSGKDKNSSVAPVSINDENKLRFEYNASSSSKVISLDASYIDVKGTKYSGSVTLQPYTSVVLMVDPNPSAPPATPVFVNATVENAAPSVIELNYNLTLANIVPPVSSFTVQVNSVARSVSSVSVSGSKVLLTLSSPVINGNTVSVSYTAPSSNPIQTPAGGKAESFSSQNVTNKVNPPATPVFQSASIENSAPSVVELNYNLTLANIVPVVSAFTVLVNSAARSVNSVSVSGTKVLLTLSSPAAYGNTVTVSYTVPSSNPLQTSSGGIAASFSAQTVTNRINAPPATPIFVSAVIENAKPSVLEMNFNLSLANIIPPVSAFSVIVNSVSRSINSVSISGTKVSLTLSSAVVYGNVVTVAYTRPSGNPLQTAAGGQAGSFVAQSVTNRVNAVSTPPPAIINNPPVIITESTPGTYSGFVGSINAGLSYDSDKDNLSYAWKVPGIISVSSLNGSSIQFLAPIVDISQSFDFSLTVSDGKTSVSKTIPVLIIPYQPGLEVATVISVESGEINSTYNPYNIIDGNIGTVWMANGTDKWIIMELSEPFSIQHVKVAFQPGQKRESYFDIYGSDDNTTWDPILLKSRSCSFSGDLQVFDFPVSKSSKEYRYIKLIGQGNSGDSWNFISEFRIFGNSHKNPTDYENLAVKIYPNPASELVTVQIDKQTFNPDFIKIASLGGKVIYLEKIEPGMKQIKIPIEFRQGIYIVQMGSGDITMFTQKLIVTR